MMFALNGSDGRMNLYLMGIRLLNLKGFFIGPRFDLFTDSKEAQKLSFREKTTCELGHLNSAHSWIV